MIQRASLKVNNRRFKEFFDRYFHIPLPIVTKHELLFIYLNGSQLHNDKAQAAQLIAVYM